MCFSVLKTLRKYVFDKWIIHMFQMVTPPSNSRKSEIHRLHEFHLESPAARPAAFMNAMNTSLGILDQFFETEESGVNGFFCR